MRKISLIAKCFTICVLCMLSGGSVFAQNNLVLVSGTDFSCSGKDPDDHIASVDDVDGDLGILHPFLKTSLRLATTTKSTAASSDFLGRNTLYAITPNPMLLDERRLMDEDGWGFVVSGLPTSPQDQTPVLEFSVHGLKPGSDYRVEVEMVLPLSADFLADMNSYNPKLKVSVNNTNQGQSGTNSSGFDKNRDRSGATETITISCTNGRISTTPNNGGNDSRTIGRDGELNVKIFMPQGASQQAVMIKSIKVYGVPDAKILGAETVCVGGETATIAVEGNYKDATYTWYRDNAKITQTGSTIVHTSDLRTPGTHTYYYEMTVPDGNGGTKKIKSESLKITDKQCCTNDEGAAASQKLIWENDFGTFESASRFYVMDYSDLAEPKKKYYNTTGKYRYCLDDIGMSAPEGAGNCGLTGTFGDNYHTVAACMSDASGSELGWAAQFGGTGEYYGPGRANGEFFIDHTDKFKGTGKMGACLFVNAVKGDYSNSPYRIYHEDIPGLCDHTNLTVKCWINTFSDGANDVAIQIRVYEPSNPNNFQQSQIVRKKANGSSAWVEVTLDEISIDGDVLSFDILDYSSNANDQGDDLLLDDIRVYACSSPKVNLYFDLPTADKDSTTCDGDDIVLHAEESLMLKNYYTSHGEVKLAYYYQYTTEDPEKESTKKTWKTINTTPTKDTAFSENIETLVKDWKDRNPSPAGTFPPLYFRVVAGNIDKLTDKGPNFYYNPDDPCSNYTVSDPIPLTISCPSCTEPLDPKISASGGTVDTRSKMKTVHLCRGETTTLSSNDVKSKDKNDDDYDNFRITWHKDKSTAVALHTVNKGTKADDIDVSWDNVSADGSMYILLVHDNFENTAGTHSCDKADTIMIYGDTVPVAPVLKIPAFCEGLASDNDGVKQYIRDISSKLSGYTETIEDAAGGQTNLSRFLTVLDGLSASNSPVTFSIYVTDDVTKCVSDTLDFTVTINEIPVVPNTKDVDFVMEEGKTHSLDTAASVTEATYKLQWEPTTQDGSENLSAYVDDTPVISLSAEAEFYYYVRQVNAAGCEGPGKKVKVTVNTSPLPLKIDTVVCVNSPVDLNDIVSTTDAVYELHWYNAGATPDGSGSLTAPNVLTDVPGKYPFYVTQRSTVSPYPESKIQTVVVEVVGVYEPDTAGNTYHYCANDPAVSLVAREKKDESMSYYADAMM
nr:hypothetical protein [Paludibacteraceae bacterium]